jgi:hypothetical protein
MTNFLDIIRRLLFLLKYSPEIGTSSVYWAQQSRCPFTSWRRQTPVSETSCVFIKNRRWIMSKTFVILRALLFSCQLNGSKYNYASSAYRYSFTACDITFLAMKLRQIFPISKGTIFINQQMVQCVGYLPISVWLDVHTFENSSGFKIQSHRHHALLPVKANFVKFFTLKISCNTKAWRVFFVIKVLLITSGSEVLKVCGIWARQIWHYKENKIVTSWEFLVSYLET